MQIDATNLSFSSPLKRRYYCLFFILASFYTAFYTPSYAIADTYKIDPAHSTIRFAIKHLGFSYTAGRFDNITGIFSFDESRSVESAKATVFVKTKSINTNHEKRDDFLRSYSFFNVSKHPIAMFKATKVTLSSDDKNSGTISGKLTLLGKSHSETFDLTLVGEGKDPWLGYRMGFTAKGAILRSNYNLSFMEGAIGDKVLIEIFIEGIKQ